MVFMTSKWVLSIPARVFHKSSIQTSGIGSIECLILLFLDIVGCRLTDNMIRAHCRYGWRRFGGLVEENYVAVASTLLQSGAPIPRLFFHRLAVVFPQCSCLLCRTERNARVKHTIMQTVRHSAFALWSIEVRTTTHQN